MEKETIRMQIQNQMERFKNSGSSCNVKSYLAAAAKLYEYDRRICEMYDADEVSLSELEQIYCSVENILKNLRIQ